MDWVSRCLEVSIHVLIGANAHGVVCRINRPGGHGKITYIHYNSQTGSVDGLDVKYTISAGQDEKIDPDLVKPYLELERKSRRRRSSSDEGNKENNVGKEPAPAKKKAPPTKKAKKTKKVVAAAPKETPSSPPRPPLDAPFQEIFCDDDLRSVISELSTESIYSRPYLLSEEHRRRSTSTFASSSESDHSSGGSPVSKAKSLGSGHVPAPSASLPKSLGTGQFRSEDSKPVTTYTTTPCTGAEESSLGAQQQAAATMHVSLEHVYDTNKQVARKFIKEVVDHNDDEDATSVMTDLDVEPPMALQRRNLFGSLLLSVLNLNEGVMDEGDVAAEVNRLAVQKDHPIFEASSVEDYLATLCLENKLMRCDDQVYII